MRKLLILILSIFIISCKSDTKEKESLEELFPSASENTSTSSAAPEHSPEVEESINRGAKIYNNFCATCHLGSGQGIANAFPPLNNSDWLKDKRKASISAVKHGLKGPIEVNGEEYNSVMTDLGLTDQEIADVMNYIFTAWDNNIEPSVTLEEVAEIKEQT